MADLRQECISRAMAELVAAGTYVSYPISGTGLPGSHRKPVDVSSTTITGDGHNGTNPRPGKAMGQHGSNFEGERDNAGRKRKGAQRGALPCWRR